MRQTRATSGIGTVVAVLLLTAGGRPAVAYINTFRPETLGGLCVRTDSIAVMKVSKFSKEKAVIIYEKVKDLKGTFPVARLRESLGPAHLPYEKAHYLEWVKEGRIAVCFYHEKRIAICIGDQWSVCEDPKGPPREKGGTWTFTTRTEPFFTQSYFGDAEKLRDAVTAILAGKEVVVPCMTGGRDKELRDRSGKLVRMRASLKRKEYNSKRDAVDEPGAATKSVRPTVDEPLPRPGMGWSTYNFFVARHNEELFKRTARAYAASGLRDAGYTILRIDGGWWGNDGNRRHYYWTVKGEYAGGRPYRPGEPHVDPRNYPGGIKRLADHLHGRGFKLGFYLAPALSMGHSDNYPGNKDVKVPPPVTGLDLVERHARWVADNGIDHLFYDGYDWGRGKGTEPYTRMFTSLRKQARRVGRPIAFSINSGWHARPRDWADEWRTSPDINGQWKTILECLTTVADPKPAGKGHWNNPDYLMVGFVGDEEAKAQMSLWCVAGAPLYLSWDFRVLNAWERYVLLNTEAIAVDQDPAATPGRRLRADGAAQVWAKRLADGSRAVVLLNAADKPLTVGVRWSEVGLPAGTAQVRDLWRHKNLGAFEKGYRADLPPHGCAFVRIKEGDKPLPEPKATWAPHPGKRPVYKPLSPAGWTYRTTMSRKDDPLPNLFDGNGKTGWWSYASAGQYLEIDFGKPLRCDRVVIDRKGVGANPWPYKVHAPRSTFTLEVSADGKAFTEVARDSFGPAYTIAAFEPVTARHVRLVLRELERTSADDHAVWGAQDVYVFDTGGR